MLRTSPLPDDLASRVSCLEAENAALRAALVADDTRLPTSWGLTKTEDIIFRTLLKHDQTSKKAVAVALYGRDGTARDLRSLDVFMSRIRSKTAGANVKIETILGVGYRLADREAWAKALTLRETERN